MSRNQPPHSRVCVYPTAHKRPRLFQVEAATVQKHAGDPPDL